MVGARGGPLLLAVLCSLAALYWLPSAAAQLEPLTTTEFFALPFNGAGYTELDGKHELFFIIASTNNFGQYKMLYGTKSGRTTGQVGRRLYVADPVSRGKQKYGDPCSTYQQCGFAGSVCHERLKTCSCHEELPATNHVDKCGKAMGINESCFFNEQCEEAVLRTECRAGRCACRYEMVAEVAPDGITVCTAQKEQEISTRTLDPAMIGVLVGMALMFIIICVVLRLFSRARWRENRTIFNTPNPRLMNVSLLRDSKLLHAQDRRGSRASIRPPSRQASQQELRAHSPNLGSRRGSRASSNHSGASIRSAKSPTGFPNNHSAAPMLESVTIEIREPKN